MWDKCIVCQRPSLENLICMRSICKNSFIEAMNVRRDNIFERITGELSSVDGLLSPNVKVFYHRACYKTYTSKHNCRPFTQLEENEDTGSFVHKKAFLMSHSREIYKSLLPKDASENYQLLRQLNNYSASERSRYVKYCI